MLPGHLDQLLDGADDGAIAIACTSEGRAIVTLDSDFVDIRGYPPRSFSGIIVLGLERQGKAQVLSAVYRLLPLLKTRALVGHLGIVDDRHVRIR